MIGAPTLTTASRTPLLSRDLISSPHSSPPPLMHSPGIAGANGMAGDDGSSGGGGGGGDGGGNREEEVQIQISGSSKAATSSSNETGPQTSPTKHWHWWLMVALNIFLLIAGQTASTLLGRFYYNQGGNSKWMSTFVQTAGFPVLFIALYLFRSKSPSTQTSTSSPEIPVTKITLIYISLGLIIAADDLMYSYGLLYLPVSTYSLVCASQLAFNAVFSYVLNAQKFTTLIFNSVILLTFSAALLGVDEDSQGTNGFSHGKYILGFLLTLGASATYSLILSLMQVTFEKVIKRETFSIVLNMQIYTSLVATIASLIGLFASGEWKTLEGEMHAFSSGRLSYVMTLTWTAICWQIASVGVVGLIFVVSSLFSNVISTLALPIIPVFAVIFFHDKMDGVKIIAMLIAIWGFISYGYQLYVDDKKARKTSVSVEENS
ncbi:probable purine permease 11 isoform X1 [Phragmites australis]|uniref:probable purine permease 11 isoform X1 n=2 Tax=Phragmites australis TaxID=29695 RepID=UPI002D77840E|nr:probable purine permease 11 isoform X1 [Phragmites australis]